MTMEPLVDVNVAMGHWPFQRFGVKTSAQLRAHLARHGIAGAWVSAVESVLHPDPEETDMDLWKKLGNYPELTFVKTVNPVLGHWRSSLTEWIDERSLQLVKVYPGYHQYKLRDDVFTPVAETLTNAGLPLLVQVRLEDERAQYPLMRIPPVEVADILELNRRFPDLKIVVLCAYLKEIMHLRTAKRNVYADISFAELLNTIKTLLNGLDAGQLLFGSHTPFLYTQSAVMKLTNAKASVEEKRKLASTNALGLLEGRIG